MEKKKVMVVIDENEHSYHTLTWVLDNLNELFTTKSSLIILATQPNYNYASIAPQFGSAGLSFFSFGSNQELIKSIQQRTNSIYEGLCEKAKNVCANRGVLVEAFTEPGEPKEVICNASYEHEIDLLIMPHYCSCPLKRIFLESLSEYCLRNAKCPVLLVQKPPKLQSYMDMHTTTKFV
ncbi:universal stress protein A-like protein [Abrus precatorius]|uniref:Universal stress protein A-like protein n=1 Tax=Abrus precatorius TaxID=3816 RepID=A0A8B8M0N1_ABRPR|nr:universal stress protein A-like protein [Abrus precatorius]